jgi:hypothetical protein
LHLSLEFRLSFKANRGRNNDYMDITITPEAPVEKAVLSK